MWEGLLSYLPWPLLKTLFPISCQQFFCESGDIFYQDNALCTICKEMVSDDPPLKMLKTNGRPSHCSRKDLTPPAMLYLDKSQIRAKMGNCCHIRAGATQSSLSRLDHVQKRLRGSCKWWTVFYSTTTCSTDEMLLASTLLWYFHGSCLVE